MGNLSYRSSYARIYRTSVFVIDPDLLPVTEESTDCSQFATGAGVPTYRHDLGRTYNHDTNHYSFPCFSENPQRTASSATVCDRPAAAIDSGNNTQALLRREDLSRPAGTSRRPEDQAFHDQNLRGSDRALGTAHASRDRCVNDRQKHDSHLSIKAFERDFEKSQDGKESPSFTSDRQQVDAALKATDHQVVASRSAQSWRVGLGRILRVPRGIERGQTLALHLQPQGSFEAVLECSCLQADHFAKILTPARTRFVEVGIHARLCCRPKNLGSVRPDLGRHWLDRLSIRFDSIQGHKNSKCSGFR